MTGITIDEAVNLLTVKHLENKVKKWIRDPVAYTLYEVWQIADSKVTYHPSNLQRTCNHVATNADCIRSYSDEELAGMFSRVETDGKAYGPSGKAYWLNWLQSPVGGECK